MLYFQHFKKLYSFGAFLLLDRMVEVKPGRAITAAKKGQALNRLRD